MAHFTPGHIISTPPLSSLAENLKNVLAEIFEDRIFCALQAKLETQIPSSLIRCTSNVSHSALKIYVPASVSHLGHKLPVIVLWLLFHQCCGFYFIPPFFLTTLILFLAGNTINGSISCCSVAKSSLPPLGTGSILTVLSELLFLPTWGRRAVCVV